MPRRKEWISSQIPPACPDPARPNSPSHSNHRHTKAPETANPSPELLTYLSELKAVPSWVLQLESYFFVLFEKDTHTAPDPANIQAVRLSFPKLLYTCVCVCMVSTHWRFSRWSKFILNEHLGHLTLF